MRVRSNLSVALRVAAGVVGAGAAIVALEVTPAGAAYPPTINECDLTKTVAELNRFGSAPPQNVIVYKASAKAYAHFNGIVKKGSKTIPRACDDVGDATFFWVVFKGSGEFVRKGDGGYRNWAFSGSWSRPAEQKVAFHAVK